VAGEVPGQRENCPGWTLSLFACNNLLICAPTCVPFTGQLTASEGYAWTSTTGTYSLYQPVSTATISNFTITAIGFVGTLNFPGSFPITPGRKDGYCHPGQL
jgi:hypothetical protein